MLDRLPVQLVHPGKKVGKYGGKNGKYGGKNGKNGGKNGKKGGGAFDVPARVAVAEVTKPERLAVTETVADVLAARPVCVTVPSIRETLPALVLIV